MSDALIVFYRDVNGNGSLDTLESIPLRYGRTAQDGSYMLRYLPVGWYIVQEVDPEGYTSSTPNIVSMYLDAGVTGIVYFGDLKVRHNYIPLFMTQ